MKKGGIRMKIEDPRKLSAGVYSGEGEDGHLSDDELAGYVMGLLDEVVRRHVGVHLEACQTCASEAERLSADTHEWRSEEGSQRLESLRERTREEVLGALKSATPRPVTLWGMRGDFETPLAIVYPLGQTSQPASAVFRTAYVPQSYLTEDESAAVTLVEKQGGDLYVYVDSNLMALEGREIVLSALSSQPTLESPRWRDRLSRIDSDQVGAILIVSSEERQSLPHNAELSITLDDDMA